MTWEPQTICLKATLLDTRSLAVDTYHRVCRTSFDAPGFCVINVGSETDTVEFRRLMVDLKSEMSAIHQRETGKLLAYLSAARFDQQETTKLHLDGGPDECFLMLGYEPSDVDSVLEISDYAKCAFDLGLSPKVFMVKHNPMFARGYEMLRPYTTRIPCFSATDYQIVCINNSSAPFDPNEPAWQGVLHTATIAKPDESKRRVINSTMIASAPVGTLDAVNDADLGEFVTTSTVRRRGYDKPHLEDDG